MNIFLIGFMGSGKSTLGSKLANIIDYNFIDLDQLIETHLCLSIDEIFSTKGERYFRDIESQLLNDLDVNDTVISLGGGTPCYNDNLKVINQKGLSVYLQIPTKKLLSRLIDSKSVRPLIANYKNDRELLSEKIDDLLIEREPFYLSADIIFNAENMNPKKYNELLQQIEHYFMSF
jgi:shikimate kinase